MLLKRCLSLFFFMAIAVPIADCVSARQPQKPQRTADSSEKPFHVNVFAEYRKWRRVNSKPVMMDVEAAVRCAGPTPEQAKRTANSPHFPKYITVYVNTVGQDAMLQERVPHFPEGTVIVKEKRALPRDKAPELMTVMTKHQAGYDTAHGDWEYAVMDTRGKMEAQGRLASCRNCHDQQKKMDYVFKGYVPNSRHAGRIALDTLHSSAPAPSIR